MQELPNAEAVRRARHLAEEADLAAVFIGRCGSTRTALNVLARQAELLPRAPVDLPGDSLLDEVVQAFPGLETVAQIAPSADEPLATRIRKRSQQLAVVEQLIAPIAGQQQARGAAVHALQHEQQDLLALPEWAELREQLLERAASRSEALGNIGPLRSRRGLLKPAELAISRFVPDIRADLVASGADPGRLSFARRRLATVLSSLEQTCSAVGFEVDLPVLEEIGDASPSEIEAAVHALEVLDVAVAEEISRLDAAIAETTATVEQTTAWILARTG